MHIPLRRAAPASALVLAACMALTACGGSSVPTIPPAAPGSTADPTPVGGSQATDVRITAVNILFEPATVIVPAGQVITITFDNKDQGVPHDIVIKDDRGNDILRSEIITGLMQIQLSVPPLAAGTYPFVCTIHPNMTGTITAE